MPNNLVFIPQTSWSLIHLFLFSHTAHFDETIVLIFLYLQLLDFYIPFSFCSSNNIIATFYNQIKIFDGLLKSLKS